MVASVFSFSAFLAGLAILAIVFTFTEFRYKFRLAVVPRLRHEAFFVTLVVGAMLLVSDLWVLERWGHPNTFLTSNIFQALLGAVFFGTIMCCIYYAAIKPAVFSPSNAQLYAGAVYSTVIGGDDAELRTLADELNRSAEGIVIFAKADAAKNNNAAHTAALQVLGLISHNRLCKQVAAIAPQTALQFIKAVKSNDAHSIPIGDFFQNFSRCAIANKESLLHHEDELVDPSLIGHWRPLTRELYGDYAFVEAISRDRTSVLDIKPTDLEKWADDELTAYCRLLQEVFVSYAEQTQFSTHSFILYRAIHNLEWAISDFWSVDFSSSKFMTNPAVRRTQIVLHAIGSLLDRLSELDEPPAHRMRNSEGRLTLFDAISSVLTDIVARAGSVEGSIDTVWTVQHNMVWNRIFGWGEGWAWRTVRFRVRRSIVEEIQDRVLFNFQSARFIAIGLNVGCLSMATARSSRQSDRKLLRFIELWTQRHFLALWGSNRRVAKACLRGGISFDESTNQLVKTFSAGLEDEPRKNILQL